MKAVVSTGGLLTRRAFGGGLALALAGIRSTLAQAAGSINERMQGDFAPVHDPCIIKQGDTYYVFSTSVKADTGGHVACRRSRDLVSWERAGFVFTQIPEWARDAVPRTKGIWAPDISFFNGLYHLYYSVSSFGSNHSVIGLATNKTLDPAAPGFEWVDRGLVVRSRLHDQYNAIDPNLAVDRDGKYWLSWGSFWSGLKLARIDPPTGKLYDDKMLRSRDARPCVASPAPSKRRSSFRAGTSTTCSRPSIFAAAAPRARTSLPAAARGDHRAIPGRHGRPMLEGGGSIVIQGNERFKGTGHNAVLREGDRDFLVYHAYDAEHDGTPNLRISPIYWTPDGWPRAQL